VWANAIPLVTLLGVVFAAGIFVAELRSIRRDLRFHQTEDEKKFHELQSDAEKEIGKLRSAFDESAKDQGRRIGNLEAEQRAMSKADDVRREFSGRHTIGRDE
jgi:hypothetical protein